MNLAQEKERAVKELRKLLEEGKSANQIYRIMMQFSLPEMEDTVVNYFIRNHHYHELSKLARYCPYVNEEKIWKKLVQDDNPAGLVEWCYHNPYADFEYVQERLLLRGMGKHLLKFMVNVDTADKQAIVNRIIELKDYSSCALTLAFSKKLSLSECISKSTMAELEKLAQKGSEFSRKLNSINTTKNKADISFNQHSVGINFYARDNKIAQREL